MRTHCERTANVLRTHCERTANALGTHCEKKIDFDGWWMVVDGGWWWMVDGRAAKVEKNHVF